MVDQTTDIVRIPDGFDTTMQKQTLREYAERHFPKVLLVRLDRHDTIVDDLYVEATDRRFLDPFEVFCYVEHEPSKKMLIKYGMEQMRQVLFHFTTLHLDDLGILENNDTFLIGDVVRWGSDSYEVKQQQRDTESYWANTNIPFYIVCGADYYREGS
jgi:hypothetical protein